MMYYFLTWKRKLNWKSRTTLGRRGIMSCANKGIWRETLNYKNIDIKM